MADELMRLNPGLHVELITIKTTGDRITDRPLAELGGKGLFTKELELALLNREIDFAVHSYKDVPVTMPLVDETDLVIAAVPKRESAWDVIVGPNAESMHDLFPANARIGTSSVRRAVQIREASPDATILPLRGNIDTRLRKLREGEYDRIILAHAGLIRAQLFDHATMKVIDFIPSPGQGALALQCRRDDASTIAVLRTLHDEETEQAVNVEREVVRAVNGDCHSPIGALATPIDADRFQLRIMIADAKGTAREETRIVERSNAMRVAREMALALQNA